MAYIFESALESELLVVRVSGERYERPEDGIAALRDFFTGVASQMVREDLNRLLAVISATGAIRSLNIRAFYGSLGTMGFKAGMHFAVVFAGQEHDRPILALGVDTAERDGWTIRHFLSESEAREWLAGHGGGPP